MTVLTKKRNLRKTKVKKGKTSKMKGGGGVN